MAEGIAHTGRGGAGNISSKPPPADEDSFRTPTLKQPHYTTGRGGSGNIVSNDNPENARLAQDVSVPASVGKDPAPVHHTGRGGGGNFVEPANGNGERKDRSKSRDRPGLKDDKQRANSGVFDRAKELMGLKK